MSKINVAVIGLGKVGMEYGFDSKRKQPASHISAILENKELRLISVCEIDKNLCKKFNEKYGNSIKIFNEHLKFLNYVKNGKIDCDIITIATPENTHKEIILDILNYLENIRKPLIIFCEKPLVEDLASTKKIKEYLKNDLIQIVVNHSRRWSNTWQEAYNLKDKIGKIQKATIYFSTSPENKQILQIRDGIHIADFLSWFKIENITEINRLKTDYFIYDFYIWGKTGKIEILDFGEKLNFYKMKKSNRFEEFNDLELIFSKNIEESMIKNAYSEFVNYFNGGKLSTNIDDGINALRVFEKYVYDKKISNK